jgi:hypothetical protein
MRGSDDQLRLMHALQDALDLTDQLGLPMVGCHIDHALATLERQCALIRPAAPAKTQSPT